MKKNILIAILIVTSIASVLYAFSQKTVAEQQTMIAEQALSEAEAARAIAVAQTKVAEENLRQAQAATKAALSHSMEAALAADEANK